MRETRMKTKKTLATRFKPLNKRAVSSVITTLVISSVLLIILVIAAYVSTNILTVQMASTEFEQAKTNMVLLNDVIQDVSLRPGAGGYVQFNEREGGIGIATTTNSLSITIQDKSLPPITNLVQLVYSGGPQASAAVNSSSKYTILKGTPSAYVSLTEGLGLLNLTQDNGAKIKLDYDRVRITSAGLIDSHTNLVQMTFIHLTKGDINTGSGTVEVMVQNVESSPQSWTFPVPSISITLQYPTNPAPSQQAWPPSGWTPPAGTTQTVVVFSEIQVKVSLR